VFGSAATGVESRVVVWLLTITMDSGKGLLVVVTSPPPRLRYPEAGVARTEIVSEFVEEEAGTPAFGVGSPSLAGTTGLAGALLMDEGGDTGVTEGIDPPPTLK